MHMATASTPALWFEPAPRHFDLRLAWWIKLLVFAAATIIALLFLDAPIAVWARAHPVADLAYWPPTITAMDTTAPSRTLPPRGDVGRELMFLEQYGQLACTVVVVLAVACLDPKGRRRALAVAMACLLTLLVTHLIKDFAGRSRPFANSREVPGSEHGLWLWRGPWQFSSSWGSFPSGHTTAAFALASSLSWFYPRGRALFMTLALITATQRILHTAHYLSDVTAGIAIGVLTTRATLDHKLPGRLLALLPPNARTWWLQDAP